MNLNHSRHVIPSLALTGILLLELIVPGTVSAQYYPPTTPGYSPYPPSTVGSPYPPSASQPPLTSPFPAEGGATYATAPAGASPYPPVSSPYPGAPPATSYPPSTTAYPPSSSYPPAAGYAAFPAPTYPQTTAPVATSMMSYAPYAAVSGFKYNYSPDAGDFVSIQARNAGRWEQFPLTLHLTYPEGMGDSEKQIVKDAIAAWQKHVDIQLVDRPEQAKIEIQWATDLNTNDLGETTFTATHVNPTGWLILDKAVVRLQDPAKYVDVQPGSLKAAVMHQVGHALGINNHSDNERDVMAEPNYRRHGMVQTAVRTLANRTIGQFLGFPSYDNATPDRKRSMMPPSDRLTKRDLNTLIRLYN